MVVPARSRILLGTATVLATMLYAIDSTIVNVALPHMQGSLQATQDQASWIVTSYIVVSAIATPLAGWLGTRYGLRAVLAGCIAGFTIVSMLCGIATDLTEMVLFRAVQGAFGAALVPLSQVVLLREFPREQHGRVMALWGMGVMVGPVIGPTLGGWLTDALSWRWAFFINAPIGLVAWLGLLAAMPKSAPDRGRPFDLTGFVLLSLAVGLFQMMLDRGQTSDWFQSTEIVAYAFASALCLYMFIVHSLTARHPFVDVHLFKDRTFTVSLVMMFAIGIAVISPSVLLPSFLQQLQGYSPTQAGTLMAARGAASIVAMMIGARLASLFGPRITMTIGISLAAVSLLMMSRFSVDTPAVLIVTVGVLQGVGTPLTFMPLSLVGFSTLPDRARTEAGVLLTLLRNIGASVGVSATVAILARSAQVNQSYLTEHFTAYDAARWQAAGVTPGANAMTGALLGEIGRQAGAIAYANDFFLLAACTLVTLPLVLALRGPRQIAAPAGAAAADAGH
ncbi:MAG: DHA2 family efflux MFS transporter permease subunit [Proteobacteria bacterium]|nr:DHA2 family efflux MFS transporter permease subunit [Pseudomonadota bacterium]